MSTETPPAGGGTPKVRVALWALMVATVVAIVLLAVVNVLRDRSAGQAPPVLGEVPPFELTGSSGKPVGRDDLSGMPYVVDFVFTRCVTSCPLMTSQMQTVGEGLVEGKDFRRVSISVDPAYDTPEVLSAFQKARGLPASWWFLTGDPERVMALIKDGFHLVAEPATGNAVEPIAHSTRFVLVDGENKIRGYYEGLEAGEVARLDRDLRHLVRSR